MNTPHEQERLILDQFTRQARTFARVHSRARGDTAELVVQATRTRDSDRVLDVACGPGILGCIYARTAQHVTGIDLVPAMIEQARARQGEQNLQNIDWQVGPAAPLPFDDNRFDIVVTRYSFHHFLDHAAVLREMQRVCRLGGRVAVVDVFVSPNARQAAAYDHMEKLRDPSHVRALSLEEIRAFMDHGGLTGREERFYRLEMEMEAQLKASFPNPGDDEKIREILRDDVGKNQLGLDARRVGNDVHFTYPIAIMTGVKPAAG